MTLSLTPLRQRQDYVCLIGSSIVEHDDVILLGLGVTNTFFPISFYQDSLPKSEGDGQRAMS